MPSSASLEDRQARIRRVDVSVANALSRIEQEMAPGNIKAAALIFEDVAFGETSMLAEVASVDHDVLAEVMVRWLKGQGYQVDSFEIDNSSPQPPARAELPRRVYYVAHPIGGDVAGNVQRALSWVRWLMLSEPGAAFEAPYLVPILAGADDSDPAQRERGMADNLAVLERCDGIVLVGGRISSGMDRELNHAVRLDRDVYDLTYLGPFVPRIDVPGALQMDRERLLAETRR